MEASLTFSARLRRELHDSWFRWDPSFRSAFWRNLVLRNPLLVGVFTLLFAPRHGFWQFATIAFGIATLVNLFCIAAVQGIAWLLAAWSHWRGRPIPERMPSWYWMVSALTMPLGLELAYRVMGWFLPRVGWAWTTPSSVESRISLLFGAIFLLIFYLSKTRGEARERLRELETERLKAQLAALTAQMNPHVFFNALNTVAAFIATEPVRAEAMLVTLSELYRGVLRATQRDRHSLADELALCRAYLDLEKARFGDRLRVEFLVEGVAPERCDIPVLTLQPLVENAVKHGVAPRAEGGSVSIEARREGEQLILRVTDDGAGFGRSGHHGSGSALANCRTRLRLSYGETAELAIQDRSPGTRIDLRLPWKETPCVP